MPHSQMVGGQLSDQLFTLKKQNEFWAVYDCLLTSHPYFTLDYFSGTKEEANIRNFLRERRADSF